MTFKRECRYSKISRMSVGSNKFYEILEYGHIIQVREARREGYIWIEYFDSKEEYEEELKELQESKAKPDITKDNNLDIIDMEKMIDFVEERMENIMIRNDDKFIRNAIMAVLEAREDYIKSINE